MHHRIARLVVGMTVSALSASAAHASSTPVPVTRAAQGTTHSFETGSDSADVADVVNAFHRALASGDSAAVMAMLAPDVVIQESGGMETRDHYAGHHLPGDIAFAKALPGARSAQRVMVSGNVAWSTSSSTTRGTYRDRQINSAGAEMMVLTKESGRWRIRAIHWSSRAIKA